MWIAHQPLKLLAVVPLALCLNARAASTNTEYGPVWPRYVLPTNAADIFYVAPDGNSNAPGARLDCPTSLEQAIARAVTGDAIILRGGTYRTGNLVLNQGVILQPFEDERPVLKGSRIAADWKPLPLNIWRAKWPTLFPQKPASWWQREREGMFTPLHRFNNDRVFIDGRPLQSAGWEGELDTNRFYINYEEGCVYIANNPSNHTVEITSRDFAIIRTTKPAHGQAPDRHGLTIKGITFTQYASRAIEIEGSEPEAVADPSAFGKDVVGSTFENVTITHCSRVAGYFRGDKTVFRHCLISDTGTEGLFLMASSDCLLENNIFARNNVWNLTGYYPAAVKIFNQTRRVVCRDNLITDQPHSNGVWYDVGNHDAVFVNNRVENCLAGFFFEISHGAVCASNVFISCQNSIHILNSTNVRVFHNVFLNAPAVIERNARSAVADHFGWHPATGPDIAQRDGHSFIGNLLAADESCGEPLLQCKQAESLSGKLLLPQISRLDYNRYARRGHPEANLITWAPNPATNAAIPLKTLDELRHLNPQFEPHGSYEPLSSLPFKPEELLRL
jgi:hypothetical protein